MSQESQTSLREELGALLSQAQSGKRGALARLLSQVERSNDSLNIIEQLIATQIGGAYVIGITGPPGAGKSSLVNALLPFVQKDYERVAVLAVDPSSPFSQGAILGDRVRMTGDALIIFLHEG